MRYLMVLGLWLAGVAVAAAAADLSQSQLNEFTREADLRFGVISNLDGYRARLTLVNDSSVALPSGGGEWSVYFHSVRNIKPVSQNGLSIEHVQGDLHRLRPEADFDGLSKGESVSVTYQPSAHIVSYTDFMPRAFMSAKGLDASVFASTDTEDLAEFVEPFERPEQLKRNQADQYSRVDARSRYETNRAVNAVETSTRRALKRIVPTPKEVDYHRGSARLNSEWQIRYAGRLAGEAELLQGELKRTLGLELDARPDHIEATGPVIELQVGRDDTRGADLPAGAESYTLAVDDDRIVIDGRDNAGAFYGVQSLLALIPPGAAGEAELPELTLADSPRDSWRGMHYDMGRNFHGKAVTLRLIDQMARYKLNKLHLHLTEDEGWRLEIPGLPELTQIGGQRCFDLSESECLLTQLGTGPSKSGSGNGYYSAEDFVEILSYAKARHIEVIPEIDMPGHARAAIKAMEARYDRLMAAGESEKAGQYLLSDPEDQSEYSTVQYYNDNSVNVCMESAYNFVDKVMYELQQMYRQAGTRLETYHMGGDEVGAGSWTESPICDAFFAREPGVAGPADLKPYFVSRVAELADARGMALAGWEDGLMYDRTTPFNRDAFAADSVIANAWDNIWEWGVGDRAYRLANAGYEVVLSHATHLYFDHPQEPHPAERGYYWATRYADLAKVFGYMPDNLYANADTTREGKPIENLEALVGRPLPELKKPENILGIQGQVWSETIRTATQLEQMIYPRLIALAERAWHEADWEGDRPDTEERTEAFARFARTVVEKELPRLAAGGSVFHLLPPGAVMEEGVLRANAALPGTTIEYSPDAGKSWKVYTGPVEPGADSVWLRARVGDLSSRVTQL